MERIMGFSKRGDAILNALKKKRIEGIIHLCFLGGGGGGDEEDRG